MRYAPLASIGLAHKIVKGMEHVFRQAQLRHQSAQGVFMTLDRSIRMNMANVNPTQHQMPCDNDATMTIERLPFSTHQNQPKPFHAEMPSHFGKMVRMKDRLCHSRDLSWKDVWQHCVAFISYVQFTLLLAG
jgi:hypothetical protein